jgi:hypothetical protein
MSPRAHRPLFLPACAQENFHDRSLASSRERNFTDEEKETALRNLLENNPQDAEAGIIRQLLGDEKKPLSPDQQEVYERYIEPGLAEKCGFASCGRFVPAGVDYCGTCEIEFGGTR